MFRCGEPRLSKIVSEVELLYEEASEGGDDDLAHEYGMNYSTLMADIQERLDELKDDGIVMHIQ